MPYVTYAQVLANPAGLVVHTPLQVKSSIPTKVWREVGLCSECAIKSWWGEWKKRVDNILEPGILGLNIGESIVSTGNCRVANRS